MAVKIQILFQDVVSLLCFKEHFKAMIPKRTIIAKQLLMNMQVEEARRTRTRRQTRSDERKPGSGMRAMCRSPWGYFRSMTDGWNEKSQRSG